MKAVILAGGHGTRLSEETTMRPKPMVEIGGRPILWHIMKTYSCYGINEFIICCGYKGYIIKEYFANYFLHMSDITFMMEDNKVVIHQSFAEPWKVTLVDTGENTMTGGRIRRIKKYVAGEKAFCLTYGDGLSDIDINGLLSFHFSHGKLATVTAARPPGRFGAFKFEENGCISFFQEKPDGDGGWVNGGFFVLDPSVIDMIEDDDTVWEQDPLSRLARERQIYAFRHEGFWQPMDTLREMQLLNDLWNKGNAPWKIW